MTASDGKFNICKVHCDSSLLAIWQIELTMHRIMLKVINIYFDIKRSQLVKATPYHKMGLLNIFENQFHINCVLTLDSSCNSILIKVLSDVIKNWIFF